MGFQNTGNMTILSGVKLYRYRTVIMEHLPLLNKRHGAGDVVNKATVVGTSLKCVPWIDPPLYTLHWLIPSNIAGQSVTKKISEAMNRPLLCPWYTPLLHPELDVSGRPIVQV